jgi:hypothetical protein
MRVRAALARAFAVTLSIATCFASGADGRWLSGGVSGLVVTPAIIQKELGRFLWLPDTRIGQVNVANHGTTPVVLNLEVAGIAHTEDGSVDVLPCPPEVGAALILSPAAPVTVMPGRAATVRLELNRAYANMPDRSGLCAALIVSSAPVRAQLAPKGLEVGSTIVLPVMVKLPWRDRARLAVVEARIEGAELENGCPVLALKVANEGGAYVRVDGRVFITAADGSRAAEVDFGPALALPGCVRAFRIQLANAALRPGRYVADAQIRADGKAAGGAKFTVSSLGRP